MKFRRSLLVLSVLSLICSLFLLFGGGRYLLFIPYSINYVLTAVFATVVGGDGRVYIWAKVVDQFGEPVPAVKVEGDYTYLTVLDRIAVWTQQYRQFSMISDDKGEFKIKGFRARNAGFKISKSGYIMDNSSHQSFNFSLESSEPVYKQNPNQPIIIHVWKRMTTGVEMMGNETHAGLPCDGTPLLISVTENKSQIGTSLDAEIRVRGWRDPAYQDHDNVVAYWRYEIVVPGGKIQATQDQYCCVAPESGYVDKLSGEYRRGDTNYVGDYKTKFYYVDKYGHYGSGFVDVCGEDIGSRIDCKLSAYINPDGTRNLEPK